MAVQVHMTGRGKQTKTRDILHATVDHSELKCVVADVEQVRLIGV